MRLHPKCYQLLCTASLKSFKYVQLRTCIQVSPPEPIESSQFGVALLAPATEGSCTAEAKVEMMARAGPPHKMSTLSVVDSCSVFAFGGKDQNNQQFATVYCYNLETNNWHGAGYMLSSCYGIAVATAK